MTHEVLPSIRKNGGYIAPNVQLDSLRNLLESVHEQYHALISDNAILRQRLKYAEQFLPLTKYGETSPKNGNRRTTIRRGANVAGKGRLIEHRDPEEVGYQCDLFDEYLPRIIFANAINIISGENTPLLGE